VIANLLKFYKGKQMLNKKDTFIPFSYSVPLLLQTRNGNRSLIRDWVKRQNLIAENKPLKKWLKEMKNKKQKDNNDIVERANPTNEIAEHYELEKLEDFRIPEECFYSMYDEDTLQEIMDEQMRMVKLLKKCEKSKHLANRILIVFDDLVGSSLFSNRKDNPFKKLNSNHRHYSASLLMVTQAYKEIPSKKFLTQKL
jgi:hypothetical protein